MGKKEYAEWTVAFDYYFYAMCLQDCIKNWKGTCIYQKERHLKMQKKAGTKVKDYFDKVLITLVPYYLRPKTNYVIFPFPSHDRYP